MKYFAYSYYITFVKVTIFNALRNIFIGRELNQLKNTLKEKYQFDKNISVLLDKVLPNLLEKKISEYNIRGAGKKSCWYEDRNE